MANLAASITARLGLDTAPLKTALAQANSQVGAFGKGFRAVVGFLGFQQLIAGLGRLSGITKDIAPDLVKSAEAMRQLKQETSGLSDAQLTELAKLDDGLTGFASSFKGWVAQIALSADEAFKGVGDKGDGLLERLRKRLVFNTGPEPQRQAKVDAEARAAAEAQKKVATIHDEIAEAQRADATSRLSTSEKILEIETRIAAARAAQFNQPDQVAQAGAEKTEAKLKIEKAGLERQEKEEEEKAFQARIDAKLVPLNDRRSAKANAALRARTGRAIKANDDSRDLNARLNGRQLPSRTAEPAVAEPKGPGVAKASPGEERIIGLLTKIEGNLQVKVG